MRRDVTILCACCGVGHSRTGKYCEPCYQNVCWNRNGFCPVSSENLHPLMSIPLDKLKQEIIVIPSETAFRSLLLYRGGVTVGRLKSLWNLGLAMMVSNTVDLGAATRLTREAPSLRHTCGLHREVQNSSLQGAFGRFLDRPEVTANIPHFTEFVREVAASNPWVHRLERIERYSKWSTRDWRKPARKRRTAKHVNAKVEVPSYYPFTVDNPTEECDLLMRVDAAVPQSLPQQVREDVCQDLLVKVFEGSTDINQIEGDVADQIKSVFRTYPSKYGPRSLDWNHLADDHEALPLRNLIRNQNKALEPEPAFIMDERDAEIRNAIGNITVDEFWALDGRVQAVYREKLSALGYGGGAMPREDYDYMLAGPEPRRFEDTGAAPRRGNTGRRGKVIGLGPKVHGDIRVGSREERLANQFLDDNAPNLDDVVRWEDMEEDDEHPE